MEANIETKIQQSVATYLLKHTDGDAATAQNESVEVAQDICNTLNISDTERKVKGAVILTQDPIKLKPVVL